MNILINNYPVNDILKNINGVIFYMIEMGMCLKKEYGVDIFEYVLPEQQITYDLIMKRYTYKLNNIKQIITNKYNLFVSIETIAYLLHSKQQNILLKAKKIFLLNANAIDKVMFQDKTKKIINFIIQHRHNIFLLTENGFENNMNKAKLLKNIYIIRGLYFKYFQNNNIKNNNKYFMHTCFRNTLNSHDVNDIEMAKQYSIKNNLQICEDYLINPAYACEGLLYFRYHDYMPRLPYEFWYYNKDVKLLKISDGLQKRIDKYGYDLFDWDLLNVISLL